MTNIIIKGASAANGYSGASNIQPGTESSIQQTLRAERMFQAAQMNNQRVGDIAGASSLENITWGEDPFGYDHARQTSRLAVHIAEGLGVTGRDLQIVKAAGLFHDIVRQGPWQQPDPGHAMRCAVAAEEFMCKDPEWWSQKDLHQDICKIIAQHNLEGEMPTDPRAQALWDADSYEAARFAPNTREGLEILKKRLDNLCTQWAKLAEHQRRWRDNRGWK